MCRQVSKLNCIAIAIMHIATSSNRCNKLSSDNDLVFEEDTRLCNYQVKLLHLLSTQLCIEFLSCKTHLCICYETSVADTWQFISLNDLGYKLGSYIKVWSDTGEFTWCFKDCMIWYLWITKISDDTLKSYQWSIGQLLLAGTW